MSRCCLNGRQKNRAVGAKPYHMISMNLINYLLHDILTSNQDRTKNTKVEPILVC